MNILSTLFIQPESFFADLAALAQIGRSANEALNRVAYSPADRAGRAWVAQRMSELGMTVREDQAGNTIGQYPGRESLPPIALGSHTDTVPDGGAYDGALGVVAALACVRALRDADTLLRHPVEVINFAAEEATMAGGTTGSQAMAGLFNVALLDKAAWDGRPVREHLSAAGLMPERIVDARREPGSLAAYLELHIEQGERLTSSGNHIGLVEGFVGIRRYAVSFQGYANHAGTTPMDQRQDALVAAAPFVATVRETALAHGIVGTVGVFTVHPGAPNVIPGRVELIAELRGLDSAVLDRAEAALAEAASRAGASFAPVVRKPPVPCDAQLLATLDTACAQIGLSTQRMPSGAGHDAMCMATLCPQAMLFVPSQGGVSHSPDEYTTPEDCLNGARALFGALILVESTAI
jgi:beta-ureidopropionase / N-carbamoyl-L-amino-acid hydrolase